MFKKLKLWKEKHFSKTGYLYLNTDNFYVKGVVGTDIKLTLMERVYILFCGGISVILHGK